MTKTTLSTLFVLLFSLFTAHAADPVEGKWEKSDKQGQILIKVEKGKLSGYLIGVKDKKRTHDTNNPNSKLRKRKLIGLKIISGFTKGSDGKWSGGSVYDSSKGKTYKGKIWIEGGSLMMRGYVGVSMLGKTAQWNRMK